MLCLYRKESWLILLLALLSFTELKAQDPRWTNLPTYDDKFMHYGFSIGLNTSTFRYKLSEQFFNGDTVVSIKPKPSAGFTLGFIANMRLGNKFDLRLLPTVGFYERTLEYKYVLGTQKTQTIESTFIELPLLVKYKSQRRANSRMYLIGGFKTCIEAGSKKKERKASDLRTNSFDLALDYGVGFDFYYQLFKFSPEIRFSHGFVNLLQQDNNAYSKSLMKLTSHTVTIYLHFE
jgi:hypothetical protein